jgi:thiol-disulfide isomerase/thioredoxin
MWFRCTVVALGLCSLGRAQEIGDGDEFEWKPIVLTDETFDASVKEGFWLLEFYAVSNLRRTAFFLPYCRLNSLSIWIVRSLFTRAMLCSSAVLLRQRLYQLLTRFCACFTRQPWCAHCKALKPVIEKTAAALDGKIKIGV